MRKKNHEWEDEIIGLGSGLINPNSEDFRGLREQIETYSSQVSSTDKMQIKISGIKYRMETYLNDPSPKQVIPVGKFLEDLIEIIGVYHKDFATYIGINSSNLSALLKGTRRFNRDLVLKLGHIFNIDPAIWLNIQSKGDIWAAHQENSANYKQYKLNDLLNKAG
ncbi:MAG: hypothetical protein SF052_24405 [Bacteroidia bacterium]|nr:hypothetical protein [Bacteroidia bacterium]